MKKIFWNLIPLKEIILLLFFVFFIFLIIIIIPIKKIYLKKIKNFLFSYDHKKIGILYIIISFIMLIRGFIDAILMKTQQILCCNHKGFLTENHFSQIFTAHGVIMIFFVAMPMLIGIMNIIIPKQLLVNDVAFPSLNSLSFWLTFFSTMLINISLFLGEFSKAGWLGYPPLTEIMFSPWIGVDYWNFSIQISGISSIISSINFITTILKKRKKNFFFSKIPIFTWSCLCSNILIIIAFPILSILLIQIYLDRHFQFRFFSAFYGGQQMLYINLIWAWGHPEVYILIIPAFGIFSEIILYISKTKIFSYNNLLYATIAITLLSFLVWMHHFFTMGSGPYCSIFFSISTMIIGIPTGIKIFNWMFTLYYSNFFKNSLFFWFISFIIIFSIGGFAGILLSIPCVDYLFHNSMFLIAHFHTVILGGVVFGYLSGINYWLPIILNIKFNEKISIINTLLWFVGVLLTFFPLYFLGYYGMVRRSNIYFNYFWLKFLILSFLGSVLILLAILLQILLFVASKKINVNDLKNWEFKRFNHIILNNYNNYFYKKKYLKNIFYIFKHKNSKLPFLLSFFTFLFSLLLIWKIFYLSFFFIYLFLIILFLYE